MADSSITADVSSKAPIENINLITKDDIELQSKVYGFGHQTYHVKVDVVKSLGRGAEGEAYQITLQQNVYEQKNLACKEYNIDPGHAFSEINKTYNEFKMVEKLSHENICDYKFFIHRCLTFENEK